MTNNMKETLNDNEKFVLREAQKATFQSDSGNEFSFEDLMCGIYPDLTDEMVKGYLSQLVQKGYIVKLENCYFDFEIKRQ